MRRFRIFFVVLLLCLAFGAHDAGAGRPRCDNTVCGFACAVWGAGNGYCINPAEPTTGCIQLYGPDCASLEGAFCCKPDTGSGGL